MPVWLSGENLFNVKLEILTLLSCYRTFTSRLVMIILAVRTLLMKNPWEGNEYSLAQPPYNSNVMFTFRIYQSVLFYLRERQNILSLNFANIEHFRHTCLVFIAETSLISLDKSTMTFLEFALFRWREFRHVSNTDNWVFKQWWCLYSSFWEPQTETVRLLQKASKCFFSLF